MTVMAAAYERHRVTIDEYHRMVKAYVFESDARRLELIDGEIVDRLRPQHPPHAATVNRLATLMISRLGSRADVRSQSPITLSGDSEPQPDLVAARPDKTWYAYKHPTPEDTYLIVEVADSMLAHDRRRKIGLYAHAGIDEVWLVDIVAGRVTVHRDPRYDSYAAVTVFHRGDVVAPLAFLETRFPVADFLPRLEAPHR